MVRARSGWNLNRRLVERWGVGVAEEHRLTFGHGRLDLNLKREGVVCVWVWFQTQRNWVTTTKYIVIHPWSLMYDSVPAR